MRIGIIGTGRIARRFVPEAITVGVEVVCTYNPHRESVQRFVDEIRISAGYDLKALSNLDDLWNTVDAVYIATPHETHYGYIVDALSHGKHVLCEKPMTLILEQAKKAFALAKSNGLVLLEGMKTAYCPGFKKLAGIAESGLIGDIRCIEACFTKLENPDSRELTDQKYGGSFRELGSYILLPVFTLLGCNYKDISFDSIYGTNGIDLFTKADIRYPDALATLTCGLGVKSEGRLIVAGTKGYLTAMPPWWKTTHFEAHFEDTSKVIRYDEPFEGDGLRYEIQYFKDRVKAKAGGKNAKMSDGNAQMGGKKVQMVGKNAKMSDENAQMDDGNAKMSDGNIQTARNDKKNNQEEISKAMADVMERFGRRK